MRFFDHVEAACRDTKIAPADLRDLIGDFLYGVIWDAAFEDFLTRDSDEGDNITDDYLKRRGWKESPGNRAHLRALRDTPMSVYRVESVAPGKTVTLVGRLREQGPVEVHDALFSRQFDPGALVAARIFQVRGRWRWAASPWISTSLGSRCCATAWRRSTHLPAARAKLSSPRQAASKTRS